jgi:hypothetical protein
MLCATKEKDSTLNELNEVVISDSKFALEKRKIRKNHCKTAEELAKDQDNLLPLFCCCWGGNGKIKVAPGKSQVLYYSWAGVIVKH